ncbi:hypothetical protein [uncultured Microscilla sp.]|uniref:phage tail protein n=1 Tax=uncultured Microscilla sp. TaxID=432653 RepID=UPI00260CC6E9|nr:hypothetical protein [uncultured Microscilla sp.]
MHKQDHNDLTNQQENTIQQKAQVDKKQPTQLKNPQVYQSKKGLKGPIPTKQSQQPDYQSPQGKKPPIRAKHRPIQRAPKGSQKTSNQSIPEPIKSSAEKKGSVKLDDVKYFENSPKPEEYNAEAISTGGEVHTAPGKKHHLAHEVWHEVQKKQHRVKTTKTTKNPVDGVKTVSINDDPSLEKEADDKGAEIQKEVGEVTPVKNPLSSGTSSKKKSPTLEKSKDNLKGKSNEKEQPKSDEGKKVGKTSSKETKTSVPSLKETPNGEKNSNDSSSLTTDSSTVSGNTTQENIPTTPSSEKISKKTTKKKKTKKPSKGAKQGNSVVQTNNGGQGEQPDNQGKSEPVVASEAYIKFKAVVSQQKTHIQTSQEKRKQDLLNKGAAARQAIQVGVDGQTQRMSANYAKATQQVQEDTQIRKAEITKDRDEKTALITSQTSARLEELAAKTIENKSRLTQAAEDKAQEVLAIGEKEAQRALNITQKNKNRLSSLARLKVKIIQQEGGSQDEIAGFLENISKLQQELQTSGSEIASIARRDAKEAADKFRNEAMEMLPEFDKSHQETIAQITKEDTGAKQNLQDMANKAFARLDEIAEGMLAQLKSSEAEQVPLLHQVAQGAIAQIDEAIGIALQTLDEQTRQQIAAIDTFVAKFDIASGYSPIFGELETEVNNKVQQFTQKMDDYSGSVTTGIGEAATQTQKEATTQVTAQEAKLLDLTTKYTQETNKITQEVQTQSTELTKKHDTRLNEIIVALTTEHQQSIKEAETKWSAEVSDYTQQIAAKVTKALNKQDDAIREFIRDLESEVGKGQQRNDGELLQGFFSWLADAVLSFFEGVWGMIVGFFEAAWDALKAIWAFMQTALFWIIVAVAVVLIIIAAVVLTIVTGGAFLVALVTVLVVVGKALLVIGLIFGGASAAYSLYLAFTTEGLSAYERGKLFGKALFDIVLIAIDFAPAVKAAKWFQWLGKFGQVTDRVGDVNTALRLIRKADSIENLLVVLDRVNDGQQALSLLSKTKNTAVLLELLEKAGNAQRLSYLLGKVDNVKTLVALLDKVSNAEKLPYLLNKVQDTEALLALFDKVADSEKLLQMLDRTTDLNQLVTLLNKASDPEALFKLLYEISDAQKLSLLLNKVKDTKHLTSLLREFTNADRLLRCLDKVVDAAQLERVLAAAGRDTAKVERLLTSYGSGARVEALIALGADAHRLDRLAKLLDTSFPYLKSTLTNDEIVKLAEAKIIAGLESAHRSGVKGLQDWITYNVPKAPHELEDALLELQQGKRMAGEHPNSIVKVGREVHAPKRPSGDPMQEVDIITESRKTRTVERSVEIKVINNPVSKPSDLSPGVTHATEKAMGRINDGHPIPGNLEAIAQIELQVGVKSVGKKNQLEILADGTVTFIAGNGKRISKPHIFNDFVNHIPKINNHTLLSKYTLVDKAGNVLAVFERSGSTWTRVK